MLIHDLIANSSQKQGSNKAIVHGDTEIDYEGLWQRTADFGSSLARLGVKPGDRIGIYLSKRPEAVISYFGASYAGAVFVPINPGLKTPQVTHILSDCNVSVLVTTAHQAKLLGAELHCCENLRHLVVVGEMDSEIELPGHFKLVSWSEFTDPELPLLPLRKRIDNDIAAILYTSGSTGKPKGVVLSHRNLVAGAISVAGYLENCSSDRILAVLPFSFDAGFSQMTTAFHVGASVVLLDYLLPRDVIRTADRYAITGITGVPPLWNQLSKLDWPDSVASNLRYFANTGGAMPLTTLQALRSSLPTTKPFLMYGLTEAFRSTFLPPEELDNRPTSIGKAIPNAEIIVVNDSGSICKPGEPGELVHRGALVSMGYWNDPEKTAKRFRPLPNHPPELPIKEVAVWSGDTVVLDEDGFLYFVGRRDDMIKSSGYRISPTEVEETIYSTGLVDECAALGIPHQDLGQAVVIIACSRVASEESRDEVLAACRATLPNYMVPSEIIWHDSLPRNPNGKIDRKKLYAEFVELFTNSEE
jgi:acyl-CoA ligase (AMP-forming) (exosortase A-associated)